MTRRSAPEHRPHEVFGGNADYVLGREARENPAHPRLRLLGRVAYLFTSEERAEKIQQKFDALKDRARALNADRKREKGLRHANGTIDVIYDNLFYDKDPDLAPRPVLASPGVYRSRVAGEQPPEPLTAEETDDIMRAAVARARATLGDLPPIERQHLDLAPPDAPLQGDTLPTRRPGVRANRFPYSTANSHGLTDEELLARLRYAFGDERLPNASTNASSTSSGIRSSRGGGPHLHHERLPQSTDDTSAEISDAQ